VDREVRYARNGDVHLAYQVVGDGPIDLVYAPGIWSNLDVMWDEPRWARFLERLASFSRLILFDMRGIGLSDMGDEPPVLEVQMDDLRAVMDAAGSERAAVFGGARGGAMMLLFWGSYPERTRSLVLYAPVVKTVRGPDWPYGRTPEEQEAFARRFVAEMGTGRNLDLQGPSGAGDAVFVQWWARFERLVASPRRFPGVDVRSIVPNVQAPTLVLQRRGDRITDLGQARWIASTIPGGRLVALEGDDHIPFPRRCGRPRRGDRGVPDRGPPGARLRSCARDRDVHGHRGLGGDGGEARRPGLARPARTPPRGRSRWPCAAPRP